jgi:hypothetical protein
MGVDKYEHIIHPLLITCFAFLFDLSTYVTYPLRYSSWKVVKISLSPVLELPDSPD